MHTGRKLRCFDDKRRENNEISSKNRQKTGFHTVPRLNLTPPFERASKNLTIETLRQPFRAKLEVSIPNPPTENQLRFSFSQ